MIAVVDPFKSDEGANLSEFDWLPSVGGAAVGKMRGHTIATARCEKCAQQL
jgi:hypothetical protein